MPSIFRVFFDSILFPLVLPAWATNNMEPNLLIGDTGGGEAAPSATVWAKRSSVAGHQEQPGEACVTSTGGLCGLYSFLAPKPGASVTGWILWPGLGGPGAERTAGHIWGPAAEGRLRKWSGGSRPGLCS